MRDAAPLEGLSLEEAVACATGKRSVDVRVDAARLSRGAAEIVPIVEDLGCAARAVSVDAENVRFLCVPALVQLADETWLVVQGAGLARVLVRGVSGCRWVRRRELGAAGLSGVAVEVLHASGAFEGSLWKRVMALALRDHRSFVRDVVATTLLLQLSGVALATLTAAVMNVALPNGATSTLVAIAAGLAAVAVFRGVTGWLRQRSVLYLGARFDLVVARGFLSHFLSLPMPALASKTVGQAFQSVSALAAAREWLVERALGAVLDAALVSGYGVALFILAPPLAVPVLAAALVMAAVSVVSAQRQAAVQVAENEAIAIQSSYLTQLVHGIATVKTSVLERIAVRTWSGLYAAELELGVTRQRIGASADFINGLMVNGTATMLLTWGTWMVLLGEVRLGTLFACMQMAAGMIAGTSGILSALRGLAVLRRQLEPVHRVLATEPEAPRIRRRSHHDARLGLAIDEIWFRYGPAHPWVLRDFSLVVRPGDKHVLSSPSGSGKTSILRILAGLYVPERGSVTVGGAAPRDVRSRIGYLPQFTHFFGGTIAENLRMFSGGAPMAQIHEASAITGLRDVCSRLPMGFDTPLVIGSPTLSGGQCQLVALTGLVAAGKSLLLLDEPTANLDPIEAERLVGILHALPCTIVMARHA